MAANTDCRPYGHTARPGAATTGARSAGKTVTATTRAAGMAGAVFSSEPCAGRPLSLSGCVLTLMFVIPPGFVVKLRTWVRFPPAPLYSYDPDWILTSDLPFQVQQILVLLVLCPELDSNQHTVRKTGFEPLYRIG
jgi:hypothetical protein